MIQLTVEMDATGKGADLIELQAKGKFIDAMMNAKISFMRLPAGTSEGNAAVIIRIDLPDGRAVLTQTSMVLFLQAADVFENIEAFANGTVPPL